MTRQITIRVSPALLAALDSAAGRTGISRHAWCLRALGLASGAFSGPRVCKHCQYDSDLRDADESITATSRPVSLTLKPSVEYHDRWTRAAFQCALSIREWAALMLAVAAGVSELGICCERLKIICQSP